MGRTLSTFVMFVVGQILSFAEIPQGYYTLLDGKKDSELKDACYQVIHNLTRVSSYTALPQYFEETDIYPNSDRWWDMYSDIPLYAPSFYGLNREHSFPKSWWGGLTDVNAYTDLNHLFPAEASANRAKSNYPLGMVDTTAKVYFDNGISKVGYPVVGQGGGAQYVFEPDDEYKGDFARTYFYMVTCYQDYIWTQKYMYMLQQNAYPTLNVWSTDLLLKWSREDPVSQKEVERNEKVYSFQNNRNPFIDFPQLSEYIWGNKKGENFTLDIADFPTGNPELITPTQGMTLDMGEVAIGASVTAQLFFKGEYLTSDLSLIIYKGDKDEFSIASDVISYNLVNSVDGYWLNVTYAPKGLGHHESRLLISDGGIDGSRAVTLRGDCLDVPILDACTATAATDITSDSYRANWIMPDNDVVDYFLLTRTIYTNGEVTQRQYVAEECSLLIDEFDHSDQESYYVQSARLGYYSDPSNVIFVNHAGITGLEQDQPLLIIPIDGTIRIVCSAPQTNMCVYDLTGVLQLSIPEVSNNIDIPLKLGMYIITTDQHKIPIKVSVR